MKQDEQVGLGILLTLVVLFMVSVISYLLWQDKNCDREYYKEWVKICVEDEQKIIPTGKAVIVHRYCVKYKDTLVTKWRYKCPKRNECNPQ